MAIAILEAARSARDVASYERDVFEYFNREIGFDVGLFVHGAELGSVTRGVDLRALSTYLSRRVDYARELAPFTASAIASGGVAVDTEFFSRKALERTAFHAEVIRPHNGRHSLVGVLDFGGRRTGVLVLGRTHVKRFGDADKRRLREALPALAVADRALRAAPAPSITTLTERERDVAGYLRLGYTNRQIALACGTSFRTVRNQLTAVFAKLGVSNRAEAVARLLGH